MKISAYVWQLGYPGGCDRTKGSVRVAILHSSRDVDVNSPSLLSISYVGLFEAEAVGWFAARGSGGGSVEIPYFDVVRDAFLSFELVGQLLDVSRDKVVCLL